MKTTFDPNSLLTPVSCRFGAPMGRPSIHENPEADVTLFRVRFVDGDYDQGGAYWGGGSPLYAAIGDDFQHFLRAESLESARGELLREFPSLNISTGELNDDFLDGYLACALWASSTDSGEPLDGEYSVGDFSPECLGKMRGECLDFWKQAGALLCDDTCKVDQWASQAGHDFWLTRNRHGAGFWDGDWNEPAATELTKLAHGFGEVSLYVHLGMIEQD